MKTPQQNRGTRFAKALDDLLAKERKLARAFNAWDKARRKIQRLEKGLELDIADKVS